MTDQPETANRPARPRRVIILGSTGSIGRQTLDVIEGVEFELQNVEGSGGETVKVTGVPERQCTEESLDGQSDSGDDLGGTVRFMEYEDGCPANFDDVFGPKPPFR